MKYIIMRRPINQEDEQRQTFAKACKTKLEAQTWIKNQEGQFYGPGDFEMYEKVKT